MPGRKPVDSGIQKMRAHLKDVHGIGDSAQQRSLEELLLDHETDHESVISVKAGLADHDPLIGTPEE
jgi:hypothetical protein